MDRPLRVQAEGGVPRAFWWRGRRYAVAEVLERWRDVGRWWEGEAPRVFFRLQTTGGGLWELYRELGENSWHLYKIYD
ncbi:MAG: DUF6504 family protein [Moorellales bacterium]